MTATYAHRLTIVENEEAIDFGVNKRPQGAKKGGKTRAEKMAARTRDRDIDMSVAYDSAKIKSECVKKLADKNKLSERSETVAKQWSVPSVHGIDLMKFL